MIEITSGRSDLSDVWDTSYAPTANRMRDAKGGGGGVLGVDALFERVPPAVVLFEVRCIYLLRISFIETNHIRVWYHLLFVNRTGTGENLTTRIDGMNNNHTLIVATRYIATHDTAVHWHYCYRYWLTWPQKQTSRNCHSLVITAVLNMHNSLF